MTEQEAFAESAQFEKDAQAQREKDASATRESEQAALAYESLRESMKALGAVDSDKGGDLLRAVNLPYTRVKGNALCGMTTVALQTQGALLVPSKALGDIKVLFRTVDILGDLSSTSLEIGCSVPPACDSCY